MDITKTKSAPRKILVLIIAKTSNPFEIFGAKIWVTTSTDTMKITNNSRVNTPILEMMMKNQNESPAVTTSDLNLGENVSMLYGIDECS